MDKIIPGRYVHFKGKEYDVLCIAKHSETNEDLVVYRELYGEGNVWVRPYSMWNDIVEFNGKYCKRFTLVKANGQ